MAIVYDASSLGAAQGPLQDDGFGGLAGAISSTFSPPVNSWIYVSAEVNDLASGGGVSLGVTNTGTALSWTSMLSNDDTFTFVQVFRAFNSAAQSNITVTVSGNDSNSGGVGGSVGMFFVDVWTGAKTSQAGARAVAHTSTSTTANPTVTTTASGSQVSSIAGATGATSNYTSSDVILADGTLDHIGRVYKAVNSGAAGLVAINYVTTGTPHSNFICYEILAPLVIELPLMGQVWT